MEIIEPIFTAIGVVVTAATLIVQGLKLIAGITPTTKDDEAVGKIERVIATVAAVLDKLSVAKAGK